MTKISDSSGKAAPREVVVSGADGRRPARRGVPVAPEQIEAALCELRQMLRDDHGTEAGRADLLALWMAVESRLTRPESDELREAVLARLFPPARPARRPDQ